MHSMAENRRDIQQNLLTRDPLKGEGERTPSLPPQQTFIRKMVFLPALTHYRHGQTCGKQCVHRRFPEIVPDIGVHRIHCIHGKRKLSARQPDIPLLQIPRERLLHRKKRIGKAHAGQRFHRIPLRRRRLLHQPVHTLRIIIGPREKNAALPVGLPVHQTFIRFRRRGFRSFPAQLPLRGLLPALRRERARACERQCENTLHLRIIRPHIRLLRLVRHNRVQIFCR